MNAKYSNNDFLIYALMFLATLPWLIVQLDTRIPADAAFLFTGAKHFMSGLAMKDYFYDNNPPLCFLIYIPAVLLHYIGISAPYAITFTTVIYIMIGLFFTDYFLRINTKISPLEKSLIITSYLCAITFACYAEFGQKDHLISISLMPFILAQISNIEATPSQSKTIRNICLIFFIPFLLMKPHYLLLPFSIIIYRIIIGEPIIKSLLKTDSLIIILGVFTYNLIIILFFQDFLLEILPFASIAYTFSAVGFDTERYTMAYTILLSFCGMILLCSDEKEKKSLLFFPLMALITVFIFLMQNKGFTLHAIPIYPFLYSSAALTIKIFLSKERQKKQSTILISLGCIFIIANLLGTQKSGLLTHEEYGNTPLAKLLKEKAPNQPFFFESLTTNIFYTTALYTGNTIGSRFCSSWLINYVPKPNKDEIPPSTDHLYSLIAEDLDRFKPAIIGIEKRSPPDKPLDQYFMLHEKLAKEWQNYKADGTITLKKDEYKDPLKINQSEVTYTIYKRIK